MMKPMSQSTAAVATWLAMLVGLLSVTPCHGELKLLGREKFVESPEDGVRVNAFSYYTAQDGFSMTSFHSYQTKSDAMDIAYLRFSYDNGDEWTEAISVKTNDLTRRGAEIRAYPRIGYVDPMTDISMQFWLEGVFPTGNPLEGMQHWTLRYRLSRDGGRTMYHEGPVLHVGDEFNRRNPFPDVHIGRNSMMIGDQCGLPITIRTGEILQPVQITPLGPDGKYYNPGGGYTYHDSAVIIGTWNERKRIDWRLSERVVADPKRTTRGVLEPTVAEMDDGRILMVMRGSNDRQPDLPGYKWFSISDDGGRSWTKPEPWCDTDGTPFFSPSSCSQLLRHSNGNVYWIGNRCDENPRGNLPRYPLVIAKVEPKTFRLMPETLCVIDERREGDSKRLQISNFSAFEDRATHDIRIHCSPLTRRDILGPDGKPQRVNWTADAWIYRVAVD